MPNLNPNSTNYQHSHEPNTNDLVQAMDYSGAGKPVLRVGISQIASGGNANLGGLIIGRQWV